MIIDSATLDPAHAYKLLIGSITPRAIGWISTLSKDGVANLAPVSFFTGAGRKPPMVCINLQPRSDGVTLKDTFVNIRDTGEFVANMVTLEQAHQMHRTAFEFPPGTDEFVEVGLEKAPCEVVRAPRVGGAPIAMECRRHAIIPLGEVGDHMIIGEVQYRPLGTDRWPVLDRRREIASRAAIDCPASVPTDPGGGRP